MLDDVRHVAVAQIITRVNHMMSRPARAYAVHIVPFAIAATDWNSESLPRSEFFKAPIC